jgi:hypothetical protein
VSQSDSKILANQLGISEIEIQYNSWFKKFHNLQNAMHSGNMQHNRSSRIMNSFRENFLFQMNIVTQSTTPNIHPIKDIHHCQILSMFIGLFMKY